MKLRVPKVLAAATLIGLLAVSFINAQGAARGSGSVVDPSGAVVPGASVGLRMPGAKVDLYSVTTASDGNFFFANVNPGTYDLAVAAKGFATATLSGIAADTARTANVPEIRLKLASAATESIQVSETTTDVQVTNAEVSDTLTNEQLQRLPVLDRSPLGFLLTQAGISSNGRGTSSVNCIGSA